MQDSSQRYKKKQTRIFTAIGVLLLLLLWWFLADIALRKYSVITNPIDTVKIAIEQFLENPTAVVMAICNTIKTAILSFLFAFCLALGLAILVHRVRNLKYIVRPIFTIIRTAPTMAVILILLLTLPWGLVTYVIAVMVILPLVYDTQLTALEGVPTGELDAGKALGLGFLRRVQFVYLPNMKEGLWTNVITAFGLGYKVVIAAEVLGLPMTSIGHNIMFAKQTLQYQISFMWLVVSCILAWLIETGLRKISLL